MYVKDCPQKEPPFVCIAWSNCFLDTIKQKTIGPIFTKFSQMRNILEYITLEIIQENESNKTIISIPLSHFGDGATKYPLQTPWHRRHGKRKLFPARLSRTPRP